jgi:subtilase family serine protease
MPLKVGFTRIILTAAVVLGSALLLPAQNSGSGRRITQKVDESRTVVLAGNKRSEANSKNDRGPVTDSLAMDHMLLQLQRSPQQEQDLQTLITSLQSSNSPNFHQWLTPQQFATRFSPAPEDVKVVTDWLQGHGFTVNVVYPSAIDFSGNASQVWEAFRTEIHNLDVRGEKHIANMNDPQIPAALAGVVGGVVSLHDFRPVPMNRGITPAHIDPATGHHVNVPGAVSPQFTFTSGTSTFHALVPADLETIYNLNPLFAAGISGQGQTIVLIEDSNVFSTADYTTFRSTFGLSSFAGTLTQVHPAPRTGANNCTNPGAVTGNDGEATLDVEWASAAAPSATVELASCRDSRTTFGGLIALQNLINGATTPPAIMSISFGLCESENGATANASYNSAYAQAVTEGVSVFVSAGDEGAASCDANLTKSTHGINVSGFASTPNNVAVGGTDFGDTFAGTTATYWNATNTATFGSAKSYINEIPWNDSCASVLLATIETGSGTTFGSTGFCNTTTGEQFLTTASGSGGPSGCATGTATTTGVISGTCKGYAKPTWQTGVVGIPADGVRDLPDVSLFAANGLWGHYYVFCYSNTAGGGVACTGSPSGWAGAGGTSFSSPIMAAIQSLVNQKTASKWGNPNPTYYKLAAAEYGATGSTACNSTNGNAVASTCTFYDVTQGDMDVNCTGTHNCFRPSGVNGVLSTSNTAYQPAYGTTTGWDFATGIGTINANNLVNNWNTVTH